MNSINEVLELGELFFIILFAIIFLIKMILFIKHEKEWDPIAVFYFSKIQLKMTVSKQLRKRRMRQNILTTIILILVLLFGVVLTLNFLIEGE